MDIINELKRIASEKDNTKNVLKSMNDEFEKKLHLFRVFEFAYAIDSLVAEKKYTKYINSIRIMNNQYPTRPLMITVLDSKKNDILRTSINLMNEIKELSPLIENIRDSKVQYTKCNIPLTETINIEFKKGAGNEILNYLLSDDLKVMLDYSQMQIELTDTKQDTSNKKLKM